MPSPRVCFGCNWTLKTLVYAGKNIKINGGGILYRQRFPTLFRKTDQRESAYAAVFAGISVLYKGELKCPIPIQTSSV
jgi:hypothetical protein